MTKKKLGFTKEQFLQSKKQSGIDRDILSVVLEDRNMYTLVGAEKLINDFKKRMVK